MPRARYGHDATLGPDGKIYVMGGYVWYTHDGICSNVAYNPEKDSWTILESVPGWIMTHNRFMTYDPEKNQWNSVKKIPGKKNYYKVIAPIIREGQVRKIAPERLRNTDIQRQGDGVAIVTGKDGIIYWTGGNGRWGDYGENIVLPYDPVKGKWPDVYSERIYYSSTAYGDATLFKTDIPSMIDRRIDHEAVVTSDGRIFVIGGWQKERNLDNYGNVSGSHIYVLKTVECYDPDTNKWEYKKPLKRKRMLFAAVVGPDDKIYVFGGAAGLSTRPSTQILNTTEVYDPKTDMWSWRSPMPAARKSHDAVLGADGKIYIMGGSCEVHGPPLKDVFIYDPVKDTWEKGPPMNLPRASPAAVATPDGKIYAIGGTDVGAYEKRQKLNFVLPKKHELYTGKVQDTVEVLDINELK